jgi:hypothetical protein
MFLNRNETFLTSFALDDLLNKLVAGVCGKRPVSSREVLELMSETLESSKMKQWYYSETVRSFKNSVDALSRRGFPMQMTCPLYFRVPLEDGGVDELFPSGSQVAVTPNNYDAFDLMLRQYYVYRNNPGAEGSYYDAVRRFLPISAQRNLLNPSFSPVIQFMLEHLLNPDSPWLVQSEEEWKQLGVTYAVPLAGRLFPVDSTKPATVLVPFAEAARYVELANDTCNKLNNLLKTGATLNAFRQPVDPSTATPLRAPPSAGAAAAERVVAIKPSPPPPPQQPPASRIAHSTEQLAELESIGLRRETCLSMTSAELSFWEYILQLRRNPSHIQDVSFRLEFGGGRFIDLKANGAFIPVTKYNVEQFIEAAVRKQQEVHRYINEIASTTTSNAEAAQRSPTPTPAPAGSGGGGGAVVVSSPAVNATAIAQPVSSPGQVGGAGGVGVSAGGAQVKVPTKPKSRTETSASANAAGGGGGDGSAAWHEAQLRRSDVDSAVVRSMLSLHAQFKENRLTAAELATYNLRFCLPCADGVYNLIPNGREIKVGLRNFGEFMLRLNAEKKRVEAEPEEEGVQMANAVLQFKDETEGFWTDKNILEIWTYEAATDLLAKSGLPPEEVVQQTRLQWDTHFLRNTDDPQHVMSGPKGEILPGQLNNYLALLHHRLQSIRLAILEARRCSKQPSDADSNDLGETELATATVVDVLNPNVPPAFYPPPTTYQPQSHPAPPQPTEEDLNMLSPTHNTGDLLAPPQSFNH